MSQRQSLFEKDLHLKNVHNIIAAVVLIAFIGASTSAELKYEKQWGADREVNGEQEFSLYLFTLSA